MTTTTVATGEFKAGDMAFAQNPPARAMPVIEVLRRDVEPPSTLPIRPEGFTGPRFKMKHEVHPKYPAFRCPMGLHPDAKFDCPTRARYFTMDATDAGVTAFYKWWDALAADNLVLTAAMRAIWPGWTRRKA